MLDNKGQLDTIIPLMALVLMTPSFILSTEFEHKITDNFLFFMTEN